MKNMQGKSHCLRILALLVGVLLAAGWAGPAGAFSVDVKNFHYQDYTAAPGPRVINNYNFSGGTVADNVITIPEAFVIKPGTEAGLAYVLMPIPDGENAVTVALNTGEQKAVLQTATKGGVIMNAVGAGTPLAAVTEYTLEVKLRNFGDMTDPAKVYKTQIGMGSMTGGPHPEFTAAWLPDGSLAIQAEIFNDLTDSVVWPTPPQVYREIKFGLTPADTTIALKIVASAATGRIDFEYTLNNGTPIGFATYTIPNGASYPGFPAYFPYIHLQAKYDQGEEAFHVYSFHDENGYFASAYVNDPGQNLYGGVTVACTGYLGTTPLVFETGSGQWFLQNPVPLGIAKPVVYPACHFEAAKKAGGTEVRDKSVTGYVEHLVTVVSPTSPNLSLPPVFSWTWPAEAPAVSWYAVDVTDISAVPPSRVMRVNNIPAAQTSVPYTGAPLVAGHTYHYSIIAGVNTNGEGNSSFRYGNFTYTGGGATMSYTNKVVAAQNYPANPVAGATVQAFDALTGAALATAQTGSDGSFTLSGIPAQNAMYTRITASGFDYPVYSSYIPTVMGDITGRRPYGLFTAADVTPWTPWTDKSGTGVFMGRVIDATHPDAPVPINGAVVTASKSGQPDVTYPVYYQHNGVFVTGPGKSTGPDGAWYIFGVPHNELLVITVAKAGYDWSYPTMTARAFGGGITEESFFGTAAANTVALSSRVRNVAGVGIGDVLIEQVAAAPLNLTNSLPDGAFSLRVPVGAPVQVGFLKDQYTPLYSAFMVFTADYADTVGFTMYPAGQLAAWGVDAGKGALLGRVLDNAGNIVGGAVVTYTSQQGRTDYTICYDTACSPALTATDPATGIYAVKNVAPGDTVNVTARKAGLVFNTRVFPTHADSIHAGPIIGSAAPQNRFAFSSTVAGDKLTVKVMYSQESFAGLDPELYRPRMLELWPQWQHAYLRLDGVQLGQASTTAEKELTYTTRVTPESEDWSEMRAIIMSSVNTNRVAPGEVLILNFTILPGGEGALLRWNVNRTQLAPEEAQGCLVLISGEIPASYTAAMWSSHSIMANGEHSYWVDANVNDPQELISSVTATGDGISGNLALQFNAADKQWNWWYNGATGRPIFGATPPALPLNYTMTITEKGGAVFTKNFTINTFPNSFATDVLPANGAMVSGTPVFSWSGYGAGYKYFLHLQKASGEYVWGKGDVTSPVTYDGPALTPGDYVIGVDVLDPNGNKSLVYHQFTYSSALPALKGDINGDNVVDMADGIIALKVIAGGAGEGIRAGYAISGADVNGDGRVGLAEVIYILQKAAVLRTTAGFVCGDTVNYAGESYPTVKIGEQCWFAKNLNVGAMITRTTAQGTSCSSIQKYCLNDEESNCGIYGGLYRWTQAMCGATTEKTQGVCPAGWHVPTDPEFVTLTNYLGSSACADYRDGDSNFCGAPAGDRLKAAGLCQGRTPCGDSGFNALPAGQATDSAFVLFGERTYFWTSSMHSSEAWRTDLWLDNAGVDATYFYSPFTTANSIRCVKD